MTGSADPTRVAPGPKRAGTVGDGEPDGAEVVMHIGEVAARAELSLRSLRHWEEVGLLIPSGRSEGGFRLYTKDDLEKILVIRRMKPLGFSIEEMKTVMADLGVLRDPTAGTAARQAAQRRIADVQVDATERRSKLLRQLGMADEFIALLQHELRA